MDRAELLRLVDRVMRAAYEQRLAGGGLRPKFLMTSLDVGEEELAEAVNYAEAQGWITGTHVYGATMPIHMEVTERGMAHVDTIFGDRTAPGLQVFYNLSGPNSRINIGSHDASVNVVNLDTAELFSQIEQEITEKVQDEGMRMRMLESARQLREKPDARRFADFLATGADFMSIITPFLPALTQLIT